MTVTIKDKEVTLKKSMRSFLIYESITDKVFNPKSMTEIIVYFYSVILASSKGIEISFDDFIDWMDENTGILDQFNSWLVEVNEIEGDLTKKKTKKATPKQKK